ncbi:hypothetical protein SLEP1_g7968 [Rubroshorea leprosula]|uniref:Uncharacterized protein n=1 Tax=Rubroshorea leprosula TaxID=152421 RepID=A0AAV5I9C5_9ROSI|nr:hypothetical protein SLEP1_g7968 [Rubroshorea leprosula]
MCSNEYVRTCLALPSLEEMHNFTWESHSDKFPTLTSVLVDDSVQCAQKHASHLIFQVSTPCFLYSYSFIGHLHSLPQSNTIEVDFCCQHLEDMSMMESDTNKESKRPKCKTWACNCSPQSILAIPAQPEMTAAKVNSLGHRHLIPVSIEMPLWHFLLVSAKHKLI